MIHISSYIIQLTTVHITEMIKEGKHFFYFTLLTEAAGFPESSLHLYQTKLRHIPENGKLYNDGCSEQPYFLTHRVLCNCAYMRVATRDTMV